MIGFIKIIKTKQLHNSVVVVNLSNKKSKKTSNMKKLFILTLLVFSSAVSVFAVRGFVKTNATHLSLLPIHIRINFDIATPRSGCQDGLGICKAGFGAGGRIAYTGIQAGGTVYFEKGILYVEFLKTDLGSAAKEAFLKNKVMPIESDIPLDASIVEALQSSQPITIMQGNYPVKETSSSYLVAFNCR